MLQYMTVFPIIKQTACIHTTQPTLCDILVTITEQSLPQRYLSPGVFTVNKSLDKSRHSEVTFHISTSYFHFSKLQVKLIIV